MPKRYYQRDKLSIQGTGHELGAGSFGAGISACRSLDASRCIGCSPRTHTTCDTCYSCCGGGSCGGCGGCSSCSSRCGRGSCGCCCCSGLSSLKTKWISWSKAIIGPG